METDQAPHVISVIHEFLNVKRETVETGRINIAKTVDVETATVNVPVINETYLISKEPGNPQLLDSPPPAIRTVGDRTIISVIREVSVVVKKYQLVEEIHLSRQSTVTPLVQEVELRKENVKVKYLPADEV